MFQSYTISKYIPKSNGNRSSVVKTIKYNFKVGSVIIY